MDFLPSLAVEIVGGIATAGVLAALVAFRDGVGRIEAHDHEVRALNEDAERFIRDRDRVLGVELATTKNEMAARGLLYSGALLGQLADLKRQALQEYRDEMSRKRQRYREICTTESPTIRLLRRRHGGDLRPLALSDAALACSRCGAATPSFPTSARAQ